MKISKVKLINKGTKGLSVFYSKPENRGTTAFNTDNERKFYIPIPPEMRSLFIELESHAKELLRLAEHADLNVTAVHTRGENIQLTAGVYTFDSREYSVTTALVTPDTEYADYGKLNGVIEKIYALIPEYISSKTAPSANQMLLEFQQYGPDKIKKKFDDVDLASMAEDDQVKMAQEILESMGAVVLMKEDASIDHGDDSNF